MPATFQTLDWVNEPQRIKLAFDVKGDCEFFELDANSMSLRQGDFAYIELNQPGEVLLYCMYERDLGRVYKIYSGEDSASTIATRITIRWENNQPVENIFGATDLADGVILARGLFYLGLLTPEAEKVLSASISAHQKLEWTLEYQARVQRGE